MTPPSSIAGFPEPESVAVAGDWHGAGAWASHAIRQVLEYRPFEAIVQLGDFGLWPGRGGQQYLDNLEKLLAELGMPMYVILGNHDDYDQLAELPLTDGVHVIRPHIIVLPRGYRWTWQGQTWLALGGAISIDRATRTAGVDWWWQEQITDADVDAAIAGGPADVMVCHDAPRGVPELDQWLAVNGVRLTPEIQMDADFCRHQVRRVVDTVKPACLFHGHYHHRYDGELQGDGFTTAVTGLNCNGSTVKKNVIQVKLPVETAVTELY